MKIILGLNLRNNLCKFIFAFIFTSVLVLTVPGGSAIVFAAPLEDCDLDGFDDATGVPVPWPGYDETKGDTPDGPAGSKATPTTAPAGTTDSTKDTPSKTGGTDTDKTDSTKTDSTNSQTTTKSSTSNTGKTNSNAGDKTATTSTGKTTTAASSTKSTNQDKTSSTVKSDTTKSVSSETDTNKENSTAKVSTSGSVSDKSNGTTNADESKTEVSTTDTTTSELSADNTDTLSSEENNQEETVQGREQQANASVDNGETLETDSEEEIIDNTKNRVLDLNAVINTKGTLAITETNGSIVHVGSTVNILGSGFAGNIQNLEIQIQSEAKQLGFVNSSEDGSFEAQLNIPTDLEAGIHNIVVLYNGNEISRQQIQIGPKAADSFLQALTVGFSSENKGLVPGGLILLGLLVVGIGAVGFNTLVLPGKKSKQQ